MEKSVKGTLPLEFQNEYEVQLDNYRIYGTSAGAGVQTENLFVEGEYSLDGHYLKSDGSTENNQYWSISEYISVSPNTKYTMYNCAGATPGFCWYDANKNYISGDNFNNRSAVTVTSPATAKYVRLSVCTTTYAYGTKNSDVFKLVIGFAYPSYKIPILLNITKTDFSATDGNIEQGGWDATTGKPIGTYLSTTRVRCSNYVTVNAPTDIITIKSDLNLTGYQVSLQLTDDTGICISGVTWSAFPISLSMAGYSDSIKRVYIVIRKSGNNTLVPSDVGKISVFVAPPNSSNYDLFIGDTKLYEDEYLDFVEQKIYQTILLTTHDNKDFITSDNKRFCVRRSNNG